MNVDEEWLEQFLLSERRDIEKILEQNQKVLLDLFRRKHDGFVANLPKEYVSGFTSRDDLTPPQSVGGSAWSRNDQHIPKIEEEMTQIQSERLSAEIVSALIRLFDAIDEDGSGVLSLEEFRLALQRAGQSPARARNMVNQIEALCKGHLCTLNGKIDRGDWITLVSGEDGSQLDPDIFNLADKLQGLVVDDSRKEEGNRHHLMLSSLSFRRLAWDCLCAVCTVWVATIVPLQLGFGDKLFASASFLDDLSQVEHIIDIIFLCDIALNFRTGYVVQSTGTSDAREEMCWRKVAQHYIRGWFLLDVSSSIPVSFLNVNEGRNMKSVKLIKFTRFFAILKLVRTAKVFHILEESSFGEYFEERVFEYKLQSKMRIFQIVLAQLACCHWIACTMASCGGDFISSFLQEAKNLPDVYVPAFYWAMTTCTTVGYGDIVPKNVLERLVAMVAMCIGGIFFGIVTGTFSSIISSHDRTNSERLAKMEVVNSWLQRHNFSPPLRRKIRYYFKSITNKKENCTREELAIIEELTSQLLTEVALVLIPEQVRAIPIFRCIPGFATGFLLSIMHIVSFKKGNMIVCTGECGSSMYIIKSGNCEQHLSSHSKGTELGGTTTIQLYAGDSFGEEVILSLVETYEYNVRAIQGSDLFRIQKNLFQLGMETYPEHLETMRDCYRSSSGLGQQRRGHQIDKSVSNLPDHFCDAVLANLQNLASSVEEIRDTNLGTGPAFVPPPLHGRCPPISSPSRLVT